MSQVKVKKLPTLEQEEFRQCGNCIHKKVCSIYEGAYLMQAKWDKEFGNEISGEDMVNDPAEFCDHFVPIIRKHTDRELV